MFYIQIWNSLFYKKKQKSTKGCGTSFGCFTVPQSCVDSSCTFIYKWSNENNSTNDFTIAAKTDPINPAWAAIGFSKDQFMVFIKIII